jgi:hypothetical protein
LDPQVVIEKLDNISKNLVELKEKTIAAQKGIYSGFDFDGAKRSGRPGFSSFEVGGAETGVFREILGLNTRRDWSGLAKLCDTQIAASPAWLTPYLFAGVAYANLGNKAEAIERLEFVTQNSGGDPQYQDAARILGELRSMR